MKNKDLIIRLIEREIDFNAYIIKENSKHPQRYVKSTNRAFSENKKYLEILKELTNEN